MMSLKSYLKLCVFKCISIWHIIAKYHGPRLLRVNIYDYFMGEGFILLTRGYGFMGGVYHLPFDTLKIGTYTDDIKLKLYR